MIVGPQIRAARGLIGWSQGELAKAAGVSLPTIKRMEGLIGPGRSSADNVSAVIRAVESAGVIFVDENGNGPGVRLRKGKSAPPAAGPAEHRVKPKVAPKVPVAPPASDEMAVELRKGDLKHLPRHSLFRPKK
jgi:transcriptional regulator with XRE-family HTH domain